MADALTLAQLFGPESSVNLPSQSALVDRQQFSFPGLDGLFTVGLGKHGTAVQFGGVLSTGDEADEPAAGDALQVLIDVLEGHFRDQTELNVLDGDSTSFAELYHGTVNTTGILIGVVVADFRLTTPRSFSPGGGAFRALVSFAGAFTKL